MQIESTKRCGWPTNDPLYIEYHDTEWGVRLHDDNKIFKLLVLEGMQAGLSWFTILKKRENFRKAFDNFDIKKVKLYDADKIEELMQNSGIIRNRLKINATINNARRFVEIQKESGSFDSYVWDFVGGKQKKNRWKSLSQIPSKTKESDLMSKDLLERGFKFVGSTICYSHMQATGMVNDHMISCFRYKEV